MWCFRKHRSNKELYKAMVDKLALAEESNQALLAEVEKLKVERSHMIKTQAEETCRLMEQVTQLQTEKSSLEKDFLDRLDTTLQEKTSLKLSLQQTTAELQTVQQSLRTLGEHAEEDRRRKDSTIKDAEQCIKELETKLQDQEMHLKKEMDAQEAEKQKLKEQVTQLQMEKSALQKEYLESTALCEQRSNVSKILTEENRGLSEELESVKQTLKTLEKRHEDDGQRKDSIMKDAGLYIDELKTKLQDQEMHLKKEMEERTSKFRELMKEYVDENLRLKNELRKNTSKQQTPDPQEALAPYYPPQDWRSRRQNTDVYRRVCYSPKK